MLTSTLGQSEKLQERLHAVALLVSCLLGATACAQAADTQIGDVSEGVLAEGAWQANGRGGHVREYFIAAEEELWDYAPTGMNQMSGMPFTEEEDVFVGRGPDRIGSTYLKALYHQYTDARFDKRKPRPAEWQHLGLLGPVIQAEVGDSIVVHFLNRTSRPLSIHAHGVFYEKDSEGSPYADGTSGDDKHDDAVPAGQAYDYYYEVPERAGPGPDDGPSVLWLYHSHTDEIADTYSGLVGAMIITAHGQARRNGSPRDIDRQFVTAYWVMDENQSPYLEDNVEAFAEDPASVDPEDEDFGESNLMHAINGYVYGNQPGLDMRVGERVRWYALGMGTEVDLHTPHWHGNTVLVGESRQDTIQVFPATVVAADMVPDNAGTWMFHCHVNDHISAGMMSLYRVAP